MAATIGVLLVAGTARAGELQQDKQQARELAAEVGALDARIEAAVQSYAQATAALEAVRTEIRVNERQQALTRYELAKARLTLMQRAVALYKHDVVTPIDALFSADDFSQLVDQLTLVRRVERSDRDVLAVIEDARRDIARRTILLAADERTAEKLVQERSAELAGIQSRLDERRELLAGVQADIRRLAAAVERAAPSPAAAVEPPGSSGGVESGGAGPWWPLIQKAASANGVSARGMYRLMMIESGGSATITGPGGYHGLFQYAPTTWAGSWNPWRTASINDGAAQIRATALALHLGYGHAWWDPSYSWAFGS